ncbi:MAG: VWA domain-containing protein [Myxococcales bacterium]|nr:VWA domain-containing protein [Myxococcales bacterium]
MEVFMRRFSALFLIGSLGAAGCGAERPADTIALDGGDDSATDSGSGFEIGDPDAAIDLGPSLDSLALAPLNATIFIDTTTGKAATQAYTATLGPDDVTTKATFTVDDPTLGSFSGATFTSALTLPGSTLGATTIVRASAEGKSGDAKLTIVKIRRTPDATGKKDFFFTVPYMKAPDPPKDVLKFSTNIQKVDVAFAMDTTGSMSGSITNLKSSLTSVVVPGLAAKIPSVGMAVVDHRDWGDAWVVKVLQKITTTTSLVNTAVGKMAPGGGGDYAEAQIATLDYILTGNANGTIPKVTPPAGHFGAVEFRPGAVPVVVLITDAPWHDPSGSATTATVTAGFKAKNVKFVNVNVGSKGGVAQANTLSDATASNLLPAAFAGKCTAGQCCTGYKGAGIAPDSAGGRCRLNFDGGSGDGVSDSIVTAIQAISVGSTYDITAQLSNDPTNKASDGAAVDATKFIESIRAMKEGDASLGCPANATYDADKDGIDDTFKAVTVGTPVCFEIIPKMNATVKPSAGAQFFNAFIDMVGMPGGVNLGDKRTVVFLVPPEDPGIK